MSISTIKKLFFLALLSLILSVLSANNADELARLQEQLKNTTDVSEQIDFLIGISRLLTYTDLELSIEHAEKALQLATKNDDHLRGAQVNKALGKLYLEGGRKEDALEKIEAAIRLAKTGGLKEEEASSLIALGYYWYRLGDSTNTISNYQKGFDLYEELENSDGIVQAYLKLGWGFDVFGNYEQAELSFQQAVRLRETITDTTLLINVLSGMGAFYINKSIKQQLAIQYFEEALALAQSTGDTYSIGRTYNALGFLYASLKNRAVAESFYLKSLSVFETLDNKAELCWLYTQIGELHLHEKEFEIALGYFERALGIADQLDRSTMFKAENYLMIGLVHREKGENYDTALQYFEKSLELAKSTQNTYHIMSTELAIGICHIAMNNLTEAQTWCGAALDKAQNYLQLSQDACDCLYQAAQGLGDYKAALLYHEQLKGLADSLHQEELSDRVNSLAAKQAHELELAELRKEQEVNEANMRTKSIKTIGIISFLALLIIMLLILAFVKKAEQKKQLQALSLARKELIANISHDLRTPITVMVGYVETLLMRLGKTKITEQKKYLNIILGSAERLSQLIGQLFEYSKLEAQQIELNKEPIQLASLASDALTRYQVLAQKKGVEIKMKCDEYIPVVYADEILIQRVIQNLMDNALKFTPSDGIITICLSNNKEQVQVEITDTGEGISKEKEKLIFERYEKSKSSPGAGLGLTIVKNILDLHGSVIQVSSNLNRGTKFSFSLPTVEAA